MTSDGAAGDPQAVPGVQVDVSIIVGTRGRAAALGRCVEAIGRIVHDPARWELIVVITESGDGSDRVVRRFAGSVPFRVAMIKEPRRGLGTARNSAASASRGRVLAFIDDDCYPAPDYIGRLLGAFDETGWGYLGGRVLLHDPTDARVTIQECTEALETPPRSFWRPGQIHGANMAVLREVFDAVGGFDEDLGAGVPYGGEDIDLAARASWVGYRGGYHPGPCVAHHHGRKPGKDLRRLQRRYAADRGAYYTRFVLRPESRMTFLRHWYWISHERRWGEIGFELLGGVGYLFYRMKCSCQRIMGRWIRESGRRRPA